MLFTLLTGILAAICGLITPTIARGLTQNGLIERAIADDVGALHWFGEVIPGEGTITVTGNDMEDIMHRINIINPDYMTTEPTYDVYQDIQSMYCGNYATADGNAINKLMTPFNRTIWSEMKTTGPGKCERHACMDTSAIYVCNDNPYPIAMDTWHMFQWAGAILHNCCGLLFNNPANSGQAFSKHEWGWNVIIGYGNCNHQPTDIDRPSDFPYPGVNGKCCDFCRNDKNGDPYVGGWGHDGL